MKRILSLLIAVVLVLTLFVFFGCNNKEDKTIRIVLPDGTPALAVTKLIKDGAIVGDEKIQIDIVAPSLINAEVAKGDAEFAILPTNAAANIISKGGGYKIAATNIFGVLYVIGKNVTEETFDLNDLKGKVVSSIGLGNTPQFVFEAILEDAGIPFETSNTRKAGSVSINYVADGSAVLAALGTAVADFGLVGEPVATNAGKKEYQIAFDLQKGFSNLHLYTSGYEGYPQASLVVKSSFAKERSDFVSKIFSALQENATWVNNDLNKAEITNILASGGSAVAFPAESIARCNVGFVRASAIKEDIKTYLSALYNVTLTDDAFYLG